MEHGTAQSWIAVQDTEYADGATRWTFNAIETWPELQQQNWEVFRMDGHHHRYHHTVGWGFVVLWKRIVAKSERIKRRFWWELNGGIGYLPGEGPIPMFNRILWGRVLRWDWSKCDRWHGPQEPQECYQSVLFLFTPGKKSSYRAGCFSVPLARLYFPEQ